MPKQSHSGWSGDPFHNCDCHQKTYHVSQLRRQDGLIVCPDGYDNPQRTRVVDRRQSLMADVLTNSGEEPELADILKTTDDNTSEFA